MKHERSIENLQGRLKNLGSNVKENPAIAKMEKTIANQIQEINCIKDTLSTFEAREAKLKRKIPCSEKPCPLGRKKCPFNHDLEYKPSFDRFAANKQILCRYFAGNGCNLEETQCKYSHSLELIAKMEEEKKFPVQRQAHGSGTGANLLPLGQRLGESFNDTSGTNNLVNQRFRKISHGANNNTSVEIVNDLSTYPPNDARRTLIKNRSYNEEDWKTAESSNNRPGNGQGSLTQRSHLEDPRTSQRPFRNQSQTGQSFDRRQDQDRRRGFYRREDQNWERRNYERENQDQGFRNQSKRRRY